MRIIAGEFRGRKLLASAGEATRPITDRAKQSLFDMLAARMPGARVYDLFAGSGSMGLEALSRGAEAVEFYEADRPALAALRRNITALNVASRSKVVAGDLFRHLAQAPPPSLRIDLVFLDPPYRFLRERPADLLRLASRLAEAHLAPDGLVVFRHDMTDALDLPPWAARDVRDYGSMRIELLQRPNA